MSEGSRLHLQKLSVFQVFVSRKMYKPPSKNQRTKHRDEVVRVGISPARALPELEDPSKNTSMASLDWELRD